MKTDTCLFTRIRRLHLCVKQSFPSLSEVFTHGSQCGDTTNISVYTQAHIWDGRFISTVHFSEKSKLLWRLSGAESRVAVETWGRMGRFVVVSSLCSHVDWAMLRCWSLLPPCYCHDACVGSITAEPPPGHPHHHHHPPHQLSLWLYHLFWLPSILSPHLFLYTFLCFVHWPPSLQLCLSQSNPVHCSPHASHFRFGDALWPCTLSVPPSLLLTGTPNLLVLLLTAPPESFFGG